MKFLTIQNKVKELNLEIFTLNDLIKITNQTKDTLKSKLTILVKQKKIHRIKKGYYSLAKIDNKFQLQNTYKKTYIGLYSALEFYESSTQRYNNLDLINQKILNNQNIENTNITFHKIKESLFFGLRKEIINNTEVFISNIEKTIIDCLYFSSKIYLTDVIDFIRKYKNEINIKFLIIYLNKVNSSTLNKRIGYIFEKEGIKLINLKINNKYERLNINKSNKGIKNKKWKLIINEDI